VFRDKGPNEPIINVEVKSRSQRSKISKCFSPYFVAYAFEREPQIFKEACLPQKHKCRKKL